MTHSAIRKLAIAILILWPAPCISMHGEPSQEDHTTPFSVGDKIGQLHQTKLISLGEKFRQLYQAGKFREAIPVAQEAVELSENLLGPDHPDTASTLNNLAALYDEMGNYARAELLYQRALEINEGALGSDHPLTGTALNNLAALYYKMGNYAKAEPMYQRALKIREKRLGPNHPDTASSLNNLAALYDEMGNYAKAEWLYQRALKIREETAGPDDRTTASALNALGVLYGKMGSYTKAEPLFQRALKIREKVLGSDHPSTATSLNTLAMLYYKTGNDLKAERLFQQALKAREKTLGPDHPNTATTLNDLAGLYHKIGDYAKAEPMYQRALKIRGKTLGPNHPNVASTLNNLALLKIDLGDAQGALSLITRAREVEETELANILSFTSEMQRLQFQQTTNPYSLPATLGTVEELAQAVLRQKGIVLDSLLEDRLVAEASTDPKQREIIGRLRAVKQHLMQLMLEVPKDLSGEALKQRATEREELLAEDELLEASLARGVAGLGTIRRALTVTVAQVQSVLPKQSALAELLRYYHYLGRGEWEARYGAVLIAPTARAKWVPLGTAAELEKEIRLYRKAVRGETDEATLNAVLKALHGQLWAPIEKALPEGAATVIVSPDAELSFVSFGILLTPEDRFVCEKYSIGYVASGRDLLREAKPTAESRTTMRLFANPDFAAGGADMRPDEKSAAVALRSIEMRDLQSISLPNLPGTEKESAVLEEHAKKSGWQAQATLGSKATEAELREVGSPRILHLATHGFFLRETDFDPPRSDLSRTAADIPKGRLFNPMHRSGLALARARTTIRAWANGEVPPTENDGIVTAEEVGGLKLDSTWLVVLSACDTGTGEANAGEGVMGLRRGFVQAGGQNLLMTLWPISDEITVNIMLDFYDAAFKTGNASQALADTQRDWLVKLRNERGLLAAVQLAGPFIMSSQGKP